MAVDPARDGSGDIVVRPWLNTVPGRWQPQPAEPETTGLDGLGPAVERVLRQVVRLSPGRQDQNPTGAQQAPPYVEFVLPYDLLNHDVAGLRLRSGDSKPLPLALKYAVHLRSLERMRTDDALVRTQWLERWNTLHSQGIGVHGWQASDADRLDEWLASLAAEPSRTAVVIDAPEGVPRRTRSRQPSRKGSASRSGTGGASSLKSGGKWLRLCSRRYRRPHSYPSPFIGYAARPSFTSPGRSCWGVISPSSGTTRTDSSTSTTSTKAISCGEEAPL